MRFVAYVGYSCAYIGENVPQDFQNENLILAGENITMF